MPQTRQRDRLDVLERDAQLRGEAGERQIPNADLSIGAAHNLGGTGGTSTVTILERP